MRGEGGKVGEMAGGKRTVEGGRRAYIHTRREPNAGGQSPSQPATYSCMHP